MNLSWNKLTKEEKARYMQMQMTPRYGCRSDLLPDDCSECPVCGYPVFGIGWCTHCDKEFDKLDNKLRSVKRP